jgi:hypothetical protein
VDGSVHDDPRHFAACSEDGLSVVVAPQIVGLPQENLVAILSHELGHAADFLYPMRWQLCDGLLAEWEHPDWEEGPPRAVDERTLYARRRQWEARAHDEVERTADAIAERAYLAVGTPRTIRYDGPCLLQRFEAGVAPRPRNLR